MRVENGTRLGSASSARQGRASLAGAALAALAVTGCTVGPDYHLPAKKIPAAWGELSVAGAATLPAKETSATADLATWWTTFKDPALDDLIARAVESNLDLRRAGARVREARAQRGVVAADLYPQVNAGGSYSRSRTSGGLAGGQASAGTAGNNTGAGNGAQSSGQSFGGLGRDQDFYRAGFDASWEIDVFGGVRRNVEAADADVAASIEDRRNVLVTLLGEVARNYVELRGFQRQIAIARDNLQSQQRTLKITQDLLRGGKYSSLDVARAQAQVSTTASGIPNLEASARQAMHQLGVLLGREPMALVAALSEDTAGRIPPPPPEVPVGLPSELLRRRPDVRRAERQLAAATARIGVATADLFPRFSLTGSLGLESTRFKSLGNFDSRFWSIGPSISWPILDFGRIRSNVYVQDARAEQAEALYEQTVLTALREVEDALVAYAKEQARRQTLVEAVAANRQATDLADQLLEHGRTDFLSVLEAERNLFTSQDMLVQSDRAVSANLVALYKALGGGWETSEPGARTEQRAPRPSK